MVGASFWASKIMMWRLNYDGAVSDCNYGIQRNLVRTWGREKFIMLLIYIEYVAELRQTSKCVR